MASRKKFPKTLPPPPPAEPALRRASKIVHDHRGTAVVEWQDAPDDRERTPLEVADALAITRSSKVRGGLELLNVETSDTFNPYSRPPHGPKPGDKKPPRRDLRKLSSWIKMMRELEERKKRGDNEEEE